MGASRLDYIDDAIKSFKISLNVYEYFKKNSSEQAEKFARSFNTRVRSGPQMIKDQGIIPYLTFLASKSGEDLIKNTYYFITGKNLPKPISEPEKAGYAVYFNLIIGYLNKLGVVEVGEELSIISVIESLKKNIHYYRVLEPIVMKYLVELRKLSSTYFKEEVE